MARERLVGGLSKSPRPVIDEGEIALICSMAVDEQLAYQGKERPAGVSQADDGRRGGG